jgi:hypothetical protein
MTTYCARVLVAFALVACCAGAGLAQSSYGKLVQQNCRDDYKKYCGDYGLESAALRVCMDKAGDNLSKACVKALVQDGQVSQSEVDRRNKKH